MGNELRTATIDHVLTGKRLAQYRSRADKWHLALLDTACLHALSVQKATGVNGLNAPLNVPSAVVVQSHGLATLAHALLGQRVPVADVIVGSTLPGVGMHAVRRLPADPRAAVSKARARIIVALLVLGPVVNHGKVVQSDPAVVVVARVVCQHIATDKHHIPKLISHILVGNVARGGVGMEHVGQQAGGRVDAPVLTGRRRMEAVFRRDKD
eukprot:TRINITY_DN12279_c0_g1_i6.p1 TRINITY_DN12279_c0_g1~~TRINITY_DN12279_c0_g1_i6.p1  ORF type:complete len:211 (-),score=14.73 TRINITY_DN12279_c0_g1_i6:1500-2132(-)